ncbi:MAG: CcmD family protein [Flavobacteriales bacterium]
MRTKVASLFFLFLLSALPAGSFAQEAAPAWVEETMFSSGKMTTVVIVVTAVLVGLGVWMFAMDMKLRKLERRLKK